MNSIGQKRLQQLLFAVSRSQIVAFASVTDPAMRASGNPFADIVRKVTFGTGVICWTYSSAVNRQRVREQKRFDFRAMQRSWGEKLRGTPLVSFVDEDEQTRLYLEIKIEQRHSHYFDRETGERLTTKQLRQLQKFLTAPAPQPRQQLRREVVLRDYRLDHLAELTLNGTRYTIAPAARELQKYFPTAADDPPTKRRSRTADTPQRKTRTAKRVS